MPASLPAPHADLIRHFHNATVTRCRIARKERTHLGAVYDADGALVRESLHFSDEHRARDPQSLAMVQRPRPGPLDLNLLDR